MRILIIISFLFLTGCIGETLYTIGPLQVKPGDVLTAPIKVKKMVAKDEKE